MENTEQLNEGLYNKIRTIKDVENSDLTDEEILTVRGDKLPIQVSIAFIKKYSKVLSTRAVSAEEANKRLSKCYT